MTAMIFAPAVDDAVVSMGRRALMKPVRTPQANWLLFAESHLTRRLCGTMLRRIWALPLPTG
jgi:hypothetical protein